MTCRDIHRWKRQLLVRRQAGEERRQVIVDGIFSHSQLPQHLADISFARVILDCRRALPRARDSHLDSAAIEFPQADNNNHKKMLQIGEGRACLMASET